MSDSLPESEVQTLDPLTQLQIQCDRLSNDLIECKKQNSLLIEYRKALIQSIDNCICDQNINTKYWFQALEHQYKEAFGEIDNMTTDESTTVPQETEDSSEAHKVVIAFEEVNSNEPINASNQEVVANNDIDINDDFVLVFNKQNNTIARKLSEDIDDTNEFIINKFVLKKSEQMSDNTVIGKENNCLDIDNSLNIQKMKFSPKKTLIRSVTNTRRQTFASRVGSKTSAPIKRLNERTTDLYIRSDGRERNDRQTFNQNKKLFVSLLEDLKSGKIERFVDPDSNLIDVSFQTDTSSADTDRSVVFKCKSTDCQFEARDRQSARRHVKRHNQEKPFVCNLCDKSYTLRDYLVQHLKVVHNIKGKQPLSCDIPGCDFKTINKTTLKAHSLTHSSEKPIKCSVEECLSYFKSVGAMKTHVNIHHNPDSEWICEWPGCEARFKNRSYIKRHMETHTGDNNTVAKLRDVIKNGNYLSTVDKSNPLFSDIRQQTVNDETQSIEIGPKLGYKCNQSECKFATIFKHQISQHVLTHYGKTFLCDLCDKKFGLVKYLTQHKKTVHNIDNSPMMSCPFADCQYRTTYKLGLKIHAISHQSEKPFKCDENGCDKCFKTSVLLTQHKKKYHSKSRAYPCEWSECGSTFETRDQLKRHSKLHTKAFHCPFDGCAKSYKSKRDLNRHLRNKHKSN